MKKITLALVGPSDSVELLYKIAIEREAILNVVPIVYQYASEAAKIIEQHPEVDVWVFSGKVPYNYAVAANKTNKPLLYSPHTGSSLYRALLQATSMGKHKINAISFDTFSLREIEEAFEDISLSFPTIYDNDYEGITSAAEMTEYHYQLWRQGKTDTAITCFYATYLELKKCGVPVFRIWPTRSNIRRTLDTAINMVEMARYKGGQIAIQHIAIEGYDELVRGSTSYAVKRVELKLYELLIGYAQMLRGSINIHGNGMYTIYSTRGVLEEATQQFTIMPILDDIVCHLNAGVSGGIGFGQTAYDADENAHIALGVGRKMGGGKWMVVLDDRTVIGPLSSASCLKYAVRTDDTACREMAEQLHVSVATVNKLLAVLDKIEGAALSAEDLAGYLSITPRSARRLLSILAEQNLAIVSGEEVLTKGRPRKIYTLLLQKILQKK